MSLTDVQQKRCVYCGARCDGETCAAHADLVDAPVEAGEILPGQMSIYDDNCVRVDRGP